MIVRRFEVNSHLQIISETADGIHIESPARLRPGQIIEIVWPDAGRERGRRLCVSTWAIAKLGSEGPTYGGCCRWH